MITVSSRMVTNLHVKFFRLLEVWNCRCRTTQRLWGRVFGIWDEIYLGCRDAKDFVTFAFYGLV